VQLELAVLLETLALTELRLVVLVIRLLVAVVAQILLHRDLVEVLVEDQVLVLGIISEVLLLTQ
jgi:hypothetical protein